MQPHARLAAAAILLAAAPPAIAAPAIPYVDIELLLDNSPSMEIGATPGDIAAMMYLTPCSASGAVYAARPFMPFGTSRSGQIYNAYACNAYDGQLAPYREPGCPIPAARFVVATPVMVPATTAGPRCTNLPAQAAGAATAGAPCAFACHFDTTDPLSADSDYYGLARSTLGQPPCSQPGASPGNCAITLRFDLVKTAVNQVIALMHQDNIAPFNNLAVGVFSFDTDLHQVYPAAATCGARQIPACQAGNDWQAALDAVGTPPAAPNTPDIGIQPYTGGNGAATNLAGALITLANDYLTAAGTGAAPDSPLKALFVVTDGLDDYGGGGERHIGPIDPTLCRVYKNMGYTVFVLYTPYYPLMNAFYLSNIRGIVEGTGPGTVVDNLRQCASNPIRDFIVASPADAASIQIAMELFLNRALASRGPL